MTTTRQKKSNPASLYDVHPGVAMVQKWIAEMKGKTGRTVDEWMTVIQKKGPKTERERSAWLKSEHGFGSNTASWLAARAGGGDTGLAEEDPKTYLKLAAEHVDAMYAGPKEALRPIHDEVLRAAREMGPDVKVCPCKTIVPIYREHVIAQLKPTTRTRVDLGLALAKHKGNLPARLIDTGGLAKKDRITHRIPLSSVAEFDDEARKWLREAYELDDE